MGLKRAGGGHKTDGGLRGGGGLFEGGWNARLIESGGTQTRMKGVGHKTV